MKQPTAFHSRLAVLGMLVLLLCAGVARADVEGQRIVRIDIEAPATVDKVQTREIMRLHEGDAYTADAAARDKALLYGKGDFAAVEMEPAPVAGGVRLVVRLTPRPKITSVRFEGDLKLDQDKLQDAIYTKEGKPVNPYRLTTDVQALRGLYRTEGYLFADVQSDTKEGPEGTEVTFQIAAGSLVRMEGVRFEGQAPVSENELRKVMISVSEAGLFSAGKFDAALLDTDLLAIQDAVRRKGYLDATVGHEMIFDAARERAWLVVRIWKGPQYRVEQIIIRGAEVFKPAELLAAMKLKDGDVFSRDQLDADMVEIGRMYGRVGRIFARTRTEWPAVSDRPAVIVRIAIEEGPEVTVDRVIIRGNDRTQDHVIRREVELLPGHRADSLLVEETRRRLINTGYFAQTGPRAAEPVRIEFVPTKNPNQADVVVDVQEGALGNFAISAGWSSSLGPVGNISFSHYNFDALRWPKSWSDIERGTAFAGGGQKLTVSLSPGTQYSDYRVAWTNPSVHDSPYSFGFDVYLHDYIWSDYYTDRRMGASVTLGRTFFTDLHVSLTPRVEEVRISDVDDDAPAAARSQKGSHARRALELRASWDKRDNIFFTTSGYKVDGAVELAGGPFGGDSNYLRETLEARQWLTVWNQKNWGKHVLSFGGEFGGMQATSGSVPFYDRFFLGGLGSVRGFQYRRAGPVDPVFFKQVGGDYLLLANAEYEAPLIRDTLRGVVFMDAGTVGESISDLSTDSVRASVGVGVRLRIPFGGMNNIPLGLFVSTPIKKKTHDKTSTVDFTVGTGFEF